MGQDVRHDVTQPGQGSKSGSRVGRVAVIRAVVLDIGSVLEVIDDSVFPEPFEKRHGLPPGSVAAACDWPADPVVGEMTATGIRSHWQRRLGLTDTEVDELVADQWRWYVGTLDRRLYDWFAGVRARGLKAGILSNSAPGAREAERHYGFEDIADHLVYSHEVGLKKPDPAVYALTTARLGVEPGEIVFLDDSPLCLAGAHDAGWHAVLHEETARSIAELERIMAG